MRTFRTRTWLVGLIAVVSLSAVSLLLVLPGAYAQQRPARPPALEPEQLKEIRAVEAKCAAGAAEIKGEDVDKVVKAYSAAQQAFAEKTADLPRTRESFEQRRDLGEKATAELKETLTKAVGAEKAGKVMELLPAFGMMGSRLDRMVGDLIAFKLPKEKLDKAVTAVLEYNKEQSKLFAQARESGSFESVRDKMQPLSDALNKKLSEVLSEEQMTQWKEKYARPFGGRGTGGPGGGTGTRSQ
jgi:hypothetical protein